MIEVKNIHKTFDEKAVLSGISAVFKQGQTNLIIGASGTGKSVLLKTIVGIVPPDEGAVLYNERDFYRSDSETVRQIRREIGMLFQGGALFDSKTVEENVRFPLEMMSQMSVSEAEDRVNFCLKRVGLEAAGKKMPSEISGGMKKRVGIARAIVLNPRYLFCDEPNSGLDPQTSTRIDNLIHDITKEFNITTVVVTHDMNSVMEIGEQISFLHKGKKLWEGSSEEIFGSQVEALEQFIFSNKLMRGFIKNR
jgi:phospholipid/cholesterol/gamma-HCH transport system ATP-binding protein